MTYGLCAGVSRRLDAEGAALTDAIESAIDGLSWPQVGWLIERQDHALLVETRAGCRRLSVKAIWDHEPWLCDTYVWIELEVIARGHPGCGRHRGLAGHPGETLPDDTPASVEVDLPALVEASTGCTARAAP